MSQEAHWRFPATNLLFRLTAAKSVPPESKTFREHVEQLPFNYSLSSALSIRHRRNSDLFSIPAPVETGSHQRDATRRAAKQPNETCSKRMRRVWASPPGTVDSGVSPGGVRGAGPPRHEDPTRETWRFDVLLRGAYNGRHAGLVLQRPRETSVRTACPLCDRSNPARVARPQSGSPPTPFSDSSWNASAVCVGGNSGRGGGGPRSTCPDGDCSSRGRASPAPRGGWRGIACGARDGCGTSESGNRMGSRQGLPRGLVSGHSGDTGGRAACAPSLQCGATCPSWPLTRDTSGSTPAHAGTPWRKY
jgi:hypothetical protein